MVKHDCGEIPVVADRDKNVVIGVVTDRDIVCRTIAKGRNPMELAAESCMTTGIIAVMPEMSLEEVCRIMEESKIRRIPVVDAKGSCIGIVALADLALQTRENIAGEVVKEVSTPTASAAAG
jgi:CBS domain-containing protein